MFLSYFNKYRQLCFWFFRNIPSQDFGQVCVTCRFLFSCGHALEAVIWAKCITEKEQVKDAIVPQVVSSVTYMDILNPWAISIYRSSCNSVGARLKIETFSCPCFNMSINSDGHISNRFGELLNQYENLKKKNVTCQISALCPISYNLFSSLCPM